MASNTRSNRGERQNQPAPSESPSLTDSEVSTIPAEPQITLADVMRLMEVSRKEDRADREAEQDRRDRKLEEKEAEAHRKAEEERRVRDEQLEFDRECSKQDQAHRDKALDLQIQQEERRERETAEERTLQTRLRAERRRHKIASEIPPIGKLSDPKEIVHFLRGFRKHMEDYHVDLDQWHTLLLPQLDSKTAAFMNRLDTETRLDFPALSAALTQANGVTNAYHQGKWYSTSWQQGLGPLETMLQLKAIWDSWTEEKLTRADVNDHVIMERFIECQAPTLQGWIREREPKSAEEAAKMAVTYAATRPPTTTSPYRPESYRNPYTPKRPPIKSEPTVARTTPTTNREPPRSDRVTFDRERGPRCYNCQHFGHIASNCPEPKNMPVKIKTEEARLAVRTGDAMLELISGAVNHKTVRRCVRDTGCTMTHVRAGLVQPGYMNLGDVQVKWGNGSVQTMPTTKVTIQVGGHDWSIPVIVNPGLQDYDVMLGNDLAHLDRVLRRRCTTQGKPTRPQRRNPARNRRRPARYGHDSTTNSSSSERDLTPPTSDNDSDFNISSDDTDDANSPTRDSESSPTIDSEVPGEQAQEDDNNNTTEENSCEAESAVTIAVNTGTQSEKRARTRASQAERRLERQRHAQKWGISVDLDGGADRMLQLQLQDRSLSAARNSSTRHDSLFFWSRTDGLLYRRGKLPRGYNAPLIQLVLPMPYREQVLRQAHIGKLGGHFGVAKTSAAVKRRFFWPGMKHDITDLCRRCQPCQKTKPKRTPKAPLEPLPVIRTRIAMDMVGPLPITSEGHKFLLTVCDYGTRYPEAIPLKSTTSKVNGTLKAGLRKYLVDQDQEWHKAIPFILFSIRASPHTSTGFSPFELFLGRNPKGPLDVLKSEWTGSAGASTDVVSYVTSLYEGLRAGAAAASEMEKAAKIAMKTSYDRGSRKQVFQVGDLVLVLKPTTRVKLHGQWQGPYTVVEKLSELTYRVRKLNTSSRLFTYHTNFMKLWQSPSAVCMLATVADDDMDDPSWVLHPEEGPMTVGSEFPPEQLKQLREALEPILGTFSNEAGSTDRATMSIDTGEAEPVYTPPYRVPHAQMPALRAEISKMLQAKVISPSTSAWGSPLILVKKPDGSMRPVVDYRRLNKVTRKDPYPMPRIDDLIDGLSSAQFITTLDLTTGYWQVPMTPADKEKTAFVSPAGKFQFNVMPFGLKGAPATFQRLMNDLFSEVTDHVAAYIDDVVIFSQTSEDHVNHVVDTVEKIKAAGLTVRARKCQLAMRECLFLGHVVGRGQVKPVAGKIAHLKEFKTPKTKKDVRSFLGLAGYYRRFVPHFSTTAAPLSDLTKDGRPDKVQWTPEHQEAFDQLILALTSEPVLQGPDYSKTFHLQTDASDRGVGAVLSQLDDSGQDRPVAYFSRKLLDRESNYAATDKECLAIVEGIKHFRIYLTGVQFEVTTDHRSLVWLDSVKDDGGRRTRWALWLQQFDFTIKHRAGTANGNADGMSRQAWDAEEAEEPEEVFRDAVKAQDEPRSPSQLESDGAEGARWKGGLRQQEQSEHHHRSPALYDSVSTGRGERTRWTGWLRQTPEHNTPGKRPWYQAEGGGGECNEPWPPGYITTTKAPEHPGQAQKEDHQSTI